MAEFVIGPATEVVKCFAEPIKRQFNYLCCFNANIQNLRAEAKRLGDAKDGVDGQVEAARRNVQVIVHQVETWQDDVSKIQADMSGVETEILNVKSGCLAIIPRFSLSRKAKKMAAAMKELQDDRGKFGQIFYPPPPAAMSSIPHGQVYELKSRKDFEEDIMATLREKKLSLMGIYGMGGVGKTTMAKKIMTRAREEGLFDEIVIAVVSQPIDMLRIQKDMAELLDLNLGVDSLLARAHRLRDRLMNTKKSVLIVLDDLWKGLNMEELGIPKECTILLTSRNRDVFCAMNVDKTFQVKTLDDVEAWSLFKEKVGACADDQSLFPIAQEIVRECKGLPIAIVTVGVALKDKMDKFNWKNALHELKSCNPRDIPDFLAQVYNPLKLSYDLLPSEHAKSIFHLCCLFPEDHNILISDLCLYVWGLDMFEGRISLQVARNKVQTLVEMLKIRSLLLDGSYEGYVKMHDVVRDVGIFIAAEAGLMDLNWKSLAREESIIDCCWISLFGADKITLPRGSTFPNLRFLLIEGPNSERRQLCDNLFESDRKLCVLSIGRYGGLRSLPHTIQLQKNMRTLILYNCSSLEDISVVGELISLEILRCQECHGVTELPVEIGRLNRLKLLDISDCRNLKTIKAGVISSLIRLEELTLIESFNKWELAVEEVKNAAVCELNFLSSLTTLKIHIHNASLAAEQIHLPNLEEFDIIFGDSRNMWSSYGRKMELELEREVIIGEWIQQLLRSTEGLVLLEEGSRKLLPLLPQFQSLKELFIRNAKMTRLSDATTTVFPLLEHLWLEYNVDLEEIHKGPISSDSFNNLSSIYISTCHSLRSVLPWPMGNNYVLRLECLVISDCSVLEQVVLCNEEESDQYSCITFPKLERLILRDLPRLTTICKGIDRIEFPALTQMDIVDCSNLKSLVSSTKTDHKKCLDDDSLHFFCKQATFGRLKDLRIKGYDSISRLWCDQISIEFFTKLVDLNVSNCGNIKSLFLPSIVGNLVNLKELIIGSCSEMVKVIEDKDENELMNRRITFPKLDKLLLRDLPRLTSLCNEIQSIEFPLLTGMEIKNCPNMKNLVSTAENERTCSRAINCDADDSFHLFCKSEAAFGMLKNLTIIGYDSISSQRSLSLWCDQISFGFFIGLEVLKIKNCGNIKSLFSPSIVENLVNLRELIIKSCCEMVKVIEDKDENKLINRRITFPKLDKLLLCDLPRLTFLCKGNHSIEFPLLTEMEIKNCPDMKNLVSTAENETKCDADDSLHLFCKSEAAFSMLKDLTIDGYDSNSSQRSLSLWCDQIPFGFFTQLEELSVKNCGNTKSLFSPSIAENLVNLRGLLIESCREMVKVIEGDEDKSSLFIKLEGLWLTKLPMLKVFCDWRCALQLPSLEQVDISECPEMERFSFGSLTTPKLIYISKNGEGISKYTEDLNDALFGGDFLHLDILFGTDQ